MIPDHCLTAPVAHALGRALGHFLWQGALLAIALRAALFLGAGRGARWRHLAATVCLLTMPLAFGVTVTLLLGGGHSKMTQPPIVPRLVFTPVVSPAAPAAPVDWLAMLAPLWIAGVILFYVLRLAGWVRVDRMRRRGVCAAPVEWQQRLRALAGAVRVSRPVVLLESCLAGVPQVIGYWRPVILMPVGALAGLSGEQVEAILIHELAHIRRADYLVSMAHSLIEGLFFFHPAVWWIGAVVRAEREYACDDEVIALRPNARAYAAALTTLEQSRWLALQAAAAANGGNLMKRIRRLLGEPAPARVPSGRASALAGGAALVVAVAIALVMWPPARSFAQTPAPAKPAADKQEPAEGIDRAGKNVEQVEKLLAGKQEELEAAEQAAGKAQELLQRNAAELDRAIQNAGDHSDEFARAEEQLRKAAAALQELAAQAAESQSFLADRRATALLDQLTAAQKAESQKLLDEQRMAALVERLKQAAKSTEFQGQALQAQQQALQQVEKQLQQLANSKLDEAFRQQERQMAQADAALQKARAAFGDKSLAEIEKRLQDAEKEFEQGTLIGLARASETPQARSEPGSVYQRWLDEDVAYIINADERRNYLALTTNADRDRFVEEFWKRRDPTPDTVENEFKEEHYRRLAYANTNFASSVPGWNTDRGRVYITYGPPDEIDDHPNVPRQIWRYRHIEGLGYGIEVEFTDPGRTGELRMKAPPASRGSYWRVLTSAGDAAGFAAQSLQSKGFPANTYPAEVDRPGLTQVLVGPYPDEASFAKAKAALEAAGFHPVRAQ